MGCLVVIVMWGISLGAIVLGAPYFAAGNGFWIVVVLGVLWFVALVIPFLWGHRTFGSGLNTDLQIVIAGAGIAAAVIIPQYNDRQPCARAVAVLKRLADAENDYLAKHKAFTADIKLLDFKQAPPFQVTITRADEKSFAATATHPACDDNGDGKPDVISWDSARGGRQFH